jgi:hypothetical protein
LDRHGCLIKLHRKKAIVRWKQKNKNKNGQVTSEAFGKKIRD